MKVNLREWLDTQYKDHGGFDKFVEMSRDGKTVFDLADHFGVENSVVSRWRKQWLEDTGEFLWRYKTTGINVNKFRHNFDLNYKCFGGVDKFLDLVKQGVTTKEIADYFHIVPETVRDAARRLTGLTILALRRHYRLGTPKTLLLAITPQPYIDQKYHHFGGTNRLVDCLISGMSIYQVGDIFGISGERVSKIFKKATGYSVMEYRKCQSQIKKRERLIKEKTCIDCGKIFHAGMKIETRCALCATKYRRMKIKQYGEKLDVCLAGVA